MNRQFLIRPVQLNHAFESHAGSGGGVTRRSFIKRTGGATVATMLAWNVAQQQALASGINSNCSWEFALRCDDAPALAQSGLATFRSEKIVGWDGSWENGTADNAVKLVQEATGPKKKTDDNDVSQEMTFKGTATAYQDDDADDGTPFSTDDIICSGSLDTGEYTLSLEIVDCEPKCKWISAPQVVKQTYGENSWDPEAGSMTLSTTIIPAARMCSAAGVAVNGGGGSLEIMVIGSGASVGVQYPQFSEQATSELLWDIAIVRRRSGSTDDWEWFDHAKNRVSTAS